MAGSRKIQSIEALRARGLNMHNTVITPSADIALEVARQFKMFTVRTDVPQYASSVWKDVCDFPFLKQKTPITSDELLEFKEKFTLLEKQGYIMIIADGIRYDDVQCYNAVVRLARNGDFRAEFSTKKVPLRDMYKHDGIFDAIGNIADRIRDIDWLGHTYYDRAQIIRDMGQLYALEIFNKDIELTKYPEKVGEHNDYFVFWQVRG